MSTTTTTATASNNNNNGNHHNHDGSSTAGNTIVSMVDEEDYYPDDETKEVRVEPGSHDELMYALGVNLARQLGDIRPLVENGEELAQVAKGLLDTVVGRLNDDGQRLLLSKRGKELDDMILYRA
jgi:hypothetical protein